jgi:hypothetical protein
MHAFREGMGWRCVNTPESRLARDAARAVPLVSFPSGTGLERIIRSRERAGVLKIGSGWVRRWLDNPLRRARCNLDLGLIPPGLMLAAPAGKLHWGLANP